MSKGAPAEEKDLYPEDESRSHMDAKVTLSDLFPSFFCLKILNLAMVEACRVVPCSFLCMHAINTHNGSRDTNKPAA